MSNTPDTSPEGAAASWVLIILASVTAQDMAYYLACLVSLGAIIINGDRYVAAMKRYWNRLMNKE